MGGTWVALGLGNADKDAPGLGADGKIKVPPEQNKYVLKRVFASKKEEEGFLSQSNRGLWPLFHRSYVRPDFSADDWEQYKSVNRKIAEKISEEADEKTIVWINDYHLSLCAKILKEIRPEAVTGFFWHIPWPAQEIFDVFPWKKELLEGMLSNDLLGFHTQAYVKNFLQSAESIPGCRIDNAAGTAEYNGHVSKVRAFPIGPDSAEISAYSAGLQESELNSAKAGFNAADKKLLLGIDRMDYTKGISEKIYALDRLFTKKPELAGKIVLVQIAAPTRIGLKEYSEALEKAVLAAEAVNKKYSAGEWKPVVFRNEVMPLRQIIPLYKIADACVITSLSDGMNLVSKEFVAANSGTGILVLSKFAGSAEELSDSIQINPFLADDIARGIEEALEMPEKEKQRITAERNRGVSACRSSLFRISTGLSAQSAGIPKKCVFQKKSCALSGQCWKKKSES